jgi:hypothetical protein
VRGGAVDGMVVTDVLGSGRTGLLYRAEDAATHRSAVLRRCLEPAGPEPYAFVDEALALLPPAASHLHRRGRLLDGTPVEWVVVVAAPLPSPPPSRPAPLAEAPASEAPASDAPASDALADFPWPAVSRPPPSVLRPAPRRRRPLHAALLLVLGSLGSLALAPSLERPAEAGERREAACIPDERWRGAVATTLRQAEAQAAGDPRLAQALRRRRAVLASALTAHGQRACREVEAALDSLHLEVSPGRR